jgi:hypothetical protein
MSWRPNAPAALSAITPWSTGWWTLETRETTQPVTAAASPPGNGFMAGNTNITYGGFIDIDAHLTDVSDGDLAPTSITRDFYIPAPRRSAVRAKASRISTSPPRARASSSPPRPRRARRDQEPA